MSKKFVRMLCPVCSKYRFVEPEHFDENTILKCPNCGWIYDLAQTENTSLKEGKNALCYDDYSDKYYDSLYAQENPEEDIEEIEEYYLGLEAAEEENNLQKEEIKVKRPHKCPICGKYEFPDTNSYDICPSCGWEDEEPADEDDLICYILGPNRMTKQRYREQYEELLKEDPNYAWSKSFSNSKDCE